MKVNSIAGSLEPYPLEQLSHLRAELRSSHKPVYDFGIGDPRIPTWEPIKEALRAAVPDVSQYPSIKGLDELREAQAAYLQRRFGLSLGPDLSVVPTLGAREAIFHIALCLIGRAGGRRRILCPDPGYPVYAESARFCGGEVVLVPIRPERAYMLEPWSLPDRVTSEAAAIWVNYPNNPTSVQADRGYWVKLTEWARANDVVVLSDECYIDIYDAAFDSPGRSSSRPLTALCNGSDRVLSFFSLSKRSGMTGYRSGFVAGDAEILGAYLKSRSFFGLAAPQFIDRAAVVAWGDEAHAAERRREFTRRIDLWFPVFRDLGLNQSRPSATFYLWCRTPERFADDDVAFCRALAEVGVLAAPSQWLSRHLRGHARFAMTVDDRDFNAATDALRSVVLG